VMSNLGLERHLASLGLKLDRTAVGDRYVIEQMRAQGYNIGGEPSGHIILSDYATTGDGFIAALQILAVVKRMNKPVSEVCHRFEALPQVLKNVRFKSGKPLESASVRTAIADDQRYQREAINNHLLNTDTASEGVSAWASGWGHWGNHDGDGNAARMNANGGGLLIGADTVVGQSTRLGFALGSGQISASTPARDASADVRTHTAGLYAGGREGAFQWQAGALYGQQKIRTHRGIAVGDTTARVGSDDDGHAAQGYVEGAYVFDGSRGSWAPFVNVAYQQLRTPTIREHGSFGALEIDSDRSSQTFGTLGLRGEVKLGDAGTALFGSVGWRYAWGDVDSASRMRFAGGGAAFDIQGSPIADDAGTISAGLRFRPTPAVTIDATYSGQFASDAKDQAARLSLNWAF